MSVICTIPAPLAAPSRTILSDIRPTLINLSLGPAAPTSTSVTTTQPGIKASCFSPPASAFSPAAPTSSGTTTQPGVKASRLSPLATAFTPGAPTSVPAQPIAALTLATPSASASNPLPAPDSPDAWAPGRSGNPNVPRKEHIIFVQGFFK